jgi:bifunctional UDP-N-acetylglucosamine pyrophosphorylase/glucosamine-1-phosphate N-acetyltransferase
MPLSVVILAAGQGKRMHSDLPKVLLPLAGEPLLQHVIRVARQLGPVQICVVYGHGGAEVQRAFAHEDVEWVLQAEQRGTGHAVMQAMAVIPDDHTILVLYGDVPLITRDSLEPVAASAAAGSLAILTVELDDPTGYGRIQRRADGAVTGIVEELDATPAQRLVRETHTGLMAAPAGRLRDWLRDLKSRNAQGEFYLTDVVAGAAAAGTPVAALAAGSADEVQGVNDRIQLARVEATLRRRRAEALMRAGATLADPARIDLRGHVTVDRDVFIDVNVVFEGDVHLGARVRVGAHCSVSRARIGADTEIKSHCVIEDAEVGANCRIGPFARLRPGAHLADDVHIGNFVEVKNSRIGTGSKANHLTYLGDAEVGAGVNVGAGTITCNYDGANKWPTQVGDGAFIGSGSMLVAPLRIGAGATIGAGSTITASTPDHQLTLARAAQTTVPTWTRDAKLSENEKAAVIAEALKPPG